MNNYIEIIDNKYVILSKEGIDEFKRMFSSEGNIRLLWDVTKEDRLPLFIRTVEEWNECNETEDLYVFDMDIDFEIRYREEQVEALKKYKGWQL